MPSGSKRGLLDVARSLPRSPLVASLAQFPRVSPEEERRLWRKGITNWSELVETRCQQGMLFEDAVDPLGLQGAIDALARSDFGYFAERLPRNLHYRVAATFPDDVLCLDIESTGLSRFYHSVTMVGWSRRGKYSVLLQGEPSDALAKALTDAPCVLTFNGTLFDLPFLRTHFPELPMPKCHVDLRYLCKRAGITGGQKEVEVLLGVKREAALADLRGEDAPSLWYEFLRGESAALRKLVRYNHADIEGMKVLLRLLAMKAMQREGCTAAPLMTVREAKRAPFSWSRVQPRVESTLRRAEGQIRALSWQGLCEYTQSSEVAFVGIDLTGSEKRPSGVATIRGKSVDTGTASSDEDCIRWVMRAGECVVSIDSPLCLPKGRTKATDDDPGRWKFGIMREAERILKRRGVNVYPALLPSMQGLTARGIRLATRLRRLGIPVIESYPGAAQDIMCIPRKRRGLEWLRKGLRGFGLDGGALSDPARVHDELDAATSALVGMLFWCGRFEAIGTESEGYLVIPDAKNHRNWWQAQVVGLSGRVCAGKTTAASFLERSGYASSRFSAVLADWATAEGQAPTRATLQELGARVHRTGRQSELQAALVKRLPTSGGIVIDGLRHPEDHAFLVETYGPAFRHIHIFASAGAREKRFEIRDDSPGNFSEVDNDVAEGEIGTLRDLAHEIVDNEGTLEDYEATLAEVTATGREPPR